MQMNNLVDNKETTDVNFVSDEFDISEADAERLTTNLNDEEFVAKFVLAEQICRFLIATILEEFSFNLDHL